MDFKDIISFIVIAIAFIIPVWAMVKKKMAPDYSTRARKRSRRITVQGKEVNVLQYLRRIAKRLPPLYHKKTGYPIDHYKNLKAAFMAKGDLNDVYAYINKVRKDVTKMAKQQGIKIIKTALNG